MGSGVSECACELFAPPNKPNTSKRNRKSNDGYITPDSDSDVDDTDNMNMNMNMKVNVNNGKGNESNDSTKRTKHIQIDDDDVDEKDDYKKENSMKISDGNLETNNNGVIMNKKKDEYIECIKQNMNRSQETQTFNQPKPEQMSPNKEIAYKSISDDDADDIYTINNIHEYGDVNDENNNDDNDDNLSQCSTQATRPMHITSFEDDLLDFIDTQTVVHHADNSDSIHSNSISYNSHSSHNSYHHSPIGYTYNRSLIPPKSTPVPILHEMNTVSFDDLFPTPFHQQIQIQQETIDDNNNNNIQHIRSHSVDPSVQIYATLHCPESIESTHQLPERRYSMLPILNYNNKQNNVYNDNKRLSVSSDLSISHPSHLPQYPSFSTSPSSSTQQQQSLSIYTLSTASTQRPSYSQKSMRKIQHVPSSSMDRIWSDNMHIIDTSINESNETKLRKGKQRHVLTKDNFSNWSIHRIVSEQEAMEKELISLKEWQNSRKSTNWISPTDHIDSH